MDIILIILISIINFVAVGIYAISSFGNGLLYHMGWQTCSRFYSSCTGDVSIAVEHVSIAAFFIFPIQIYNFRKHIDWKLAFNIAATQQLGLFSGIYIVTEFHSSWIARCLGILMCIVALQKAVSEFSSVKDENTPPLQKYIFSDWQSYVFVWVIGLSSGLFGGMYASGGPPLMYFVSVTNLDKNVCRGTMAVDYLIENIGRLLYIITYSDKQHFYTLDIQFITIIITLTMTSLFAMLTGNRIALYVNQKTFRYIILCLLAIGSILLATTDCTLSTTLIISFCGIFLYTFLFIYLTKLEKVKSQLVKWKSTLSSAPLSSFDDADIGDNGHHIHLSTISHIVNSNSGFEEIRDNEALIGSDCMTSDSNVISCKYNTGRTAHNPMHC
jgi:uncharacterized membrane protein YfcA